jgi:hypothetical protein
MSVETPEHRPTIPRLYGGCTTELAERYKRAVAKPTYTDDEVEAILERAIKAQQNDAGKLSHEDLVSAASEVGISREAIDAAARELKAPSGDGEVPGDAQIIRAWRKRAWRAFIRHFVTFALVNGMLAFINIAASPSFLWFPIVILGWGIGIAMQLLGILFADEERILVRERRKLEKKARRNRWKKKGDDFERAVSEGVRVLLDAANKQDRSRIAAETRVAPENEGAPEDEAAAEPEEKRRRR